MLSHSIRRARYDLSSHRRWLATFLVNTRQGRHFTKGQHVANVHACTVASFQWQLRDGHGRTYASVPAFRRFTPRHNASGQRPTEVSFYQASQLYINTPDKQAISTKDINRLADTVVLSIRKSAPEDKELLAELEGFVQLLVKDVKSGALGPNPIMNQRLLSSLVLLQGEAKAAPFWSWLESQPDEYISPKAYGTALELLSALGRPAREVEETYQRGLSRCPGNFAAYHFTPNAVLPDRTQAITAEQLNLPLSLLRGIIIARFLRGETKAAYLGLDTLLRLVPERPHCKAVRHILQERPLTEAYTAFAVYCRAGATLFPADFRAFVSRLRTAPHPHNFNEHICAIRAMISATYLYTATGGRLSNNFVNETIIAITHLLRIPSVRQLDPSEVRKVADGVLELVRKCLEIFARFGTQPGLSSFNSIITNVAGYGQSRSVFNTVLKDITAMGLKPNFVTLRSCLTAAGLLRDEALIRSTWDELVRARTAAEEKPDSTDLHVLIKAARLNGIPDLAEQEVDIWKHGLTAHEQNTIGEHLTREYSQAEMQGATRNDFAAEATGGQNESVDDVEVIFQELDKLAADFVTFEQTSSFGEFAENLQNTPLPMTLLAPGPPSMPEPEMRKLYDEYTTEQSSPGQVGESRVRPAYSFTNIPLDTLRYENWKALNFLLKQAEAHNSEFEKAVDRAIAADNPPPKRALNFPRVKGGTHSWGLSDAMASSNEDVQMSPEEVESARAEIVRLRGTIGTA